MQHDHMHDARLDVHLYMQQATLLKAVVRHVFMCVGVHRPARQQCVAVFSVAGDGIGLVNRLIALWREEFGLRQLRPA